MEKKKGLNIYSIQKYGRVLNVELNTLISSLDV